jgi:hypothetical protein
LLEQEALARIPSMVEQGVEPLVGLALTALVALPQMAALSPLVEPL